MSTAPVPRLPLVPLLALRRTRALVRSPFGRFLAITVAAAYALVSMLLGYMLTFFNTQQSGVTAVVIWQGTPWWNYPGMLVVAPGGVLALPFLSTITMLLVSAGVGLGAAAAVLLLVPGLRRGRNVPAVRSMASTVAGGATPAIAGLATLGACCCTSCVGAAGIAVVAAASGTNVGEVIRNNWYVAVFELAIVGLSLILLERSLALPAEVCPVPPPKDRRFAVGTALRLALLVAGITWSLAMFVEWGDVPPLSAPGGTWYHWVFEHQLLALLAITAGFLPLETAAALARSARRWRSLVWRAPLLLGGITWGIGVPAALVGAGLGGLGNEVMGYLGAPAAWGAIPPDSALGAPLYFHWTLQHGLLGAFAIAVAVLGETALAPLLWSVSAARPSSSAEAAGGGRGRVVQPTLPRPTANPVLAGAETERTRSGDFVGG
ncbi:MAG: hypothetical protein L3K15_02640 [Thermoplasmata archaeon]|nr:hypothetical protein [Thermoplasmata archaeon]